MTNHIPQLKPVLQVLPLEVCAHVYVATCIYCMHVTIQVTMVIVDFALRLLAPPLHAPAYQRLMDLIKVSVRRSSMLALC